MAKELTRAPESLAVWESNMKVLRERQPKLGKLLDDYTAREGHALAHFENETPAGTWIDGLTPEPFFQSNTEPSFEWSRKSRDTPIFFLYGIGKPPYLFKAIRALPTEALSLVVVEPNIALLAYTLHLTHVYQAMPRRATLTFLTEMDTSSTFKYYPAEEHDKIAHIMREGLIQEAMTAGVAAYGVFSTALAMGTEHPGETEVFSEKFKEITAKIREWVVVRLDMLGNSAQDTMLGLRQMALIAPWIAYGYSIKAIGTHFKGKPFIVVSAGPSLEKNYELLRDVQDKCVIVAADAVLAKLLDAGIMPHVVTCVERGYPTYDYFFKNNVDKYEERLGKILLLVQAVCMPQIYGRWPGPKIVLGKAGVPVDKWFIADTLGGDGLGSCLSVAHMAYAFAHACQASTVALIGQDLAYAPDGVSHAGGIFDEKSLAAQSRDASQRPVLSLPAALGGEVETTETWLTFLRALENMIMTSGIPTWDCTEGGALIAGTSIDSLQDYLAQYVHSQEWTMRETPADIILASDIEGDKSARYERIKKNFALNNAVLQEADSLLIEINETIKKVTAAALAPERRIAYATVADQMLDQLHTKNPMFAFVTQSYVYLASIELAKTRFLDTVEAVERWRDFHMEILEAHVSVLHFIKRWSDYAESALGYYMDRALPIEPLSEEEAAAKLDWIDSTLGDGHDPLALQMELDTLFTLSDLTLYDSSGYALWEYGKFLFKEGRSWEALILYRAAFERFEDKEIPVDDIVSILKDAVRVCLKPDLCQIPAYDEGERYLANAADYLGEMDEELLQLKQALLEAQTLLHIGLSARYSERKRLTKWFEARALGGSALYRGDVPAAMRLIWEAVRDHGQHIPDWGTSHLNWLVTNMEKFFDALDEPMKSTIDELLDEMVTHREVLKYFSVPYTENFVQTLIEHGLEEGFMKRIDVSQESGVEG